MINKKPISIKFREFIFKTIGKYPGLEDCPTVICFHSISEDGWLFSVTECDFELQLRALLKTKKVVGLKKLLGEKDKHIKNSVAITFDDGYETIFTSAYPVLKKYGLTACVFINTVTDKDGESKYFEGKKLMNLKQIRKLKQEGWEIGYHTKSHPDLRFLSVTGLADEIIKSKEEIEGKLGYKIDCFAYPHGLFNKKTVDIVRKAGYTAAFTADGGGINFRRSSFKIGRVLLDKYIKTEDLRVLSSRQGLFFNKLLTSCFRIKDDYFGLRKFRKGFINEV